MLADLKVLLGIGDDTQDALLQLLLDQTTALLVGELNRPTVPAGAQYLLLEMTADAYRLHRQAAGEGAGEVTGSVSSLSDNGQSVSYRDGRPPRGGRGLRWQEQSLEPCKALSPSARRAGIEIFTTGIKSWWTKSPSARRAGIEILLLAASSPRQRVALREEGGD